MIIKCKLEWKSRNLTGGKEVETIWVRVQIETQKCAHDSHASRYGSWHLLRVTVQSHCFFLPNLLFLHLTVCSLAFLGFCIGLWPLTLGLRLLLMAYWIQLSLSEHVVLGSSAAPT